APDLIVAGGGAALVAGDLGSSTTLIDVFALDNTVALAQLTSPQRVVAGGGLLAQAAFTGCDQSAVTLALVACDVRRQSAVLRQVLGVQTVAVGGAVGVTTVRAASVVAIGSGTRFDACTLD